MGKGRKIRCLSRIVSLALALTMLTESFLGSGNVVLAADQEGTEMGQETGDAVLEEVQTEGNSGEYDTEGLDILLYGIGLSTDAGRHLSCKCVCRGASAQNGPINIV